MSSKIAVFIHLHKLIILFVNCFKTTISYTKYLIFLFIFILIFSIASIVDHSCNFNIKIILIYIKKNKRNLKDE